MPRNVRNFWITLDVDGRKTPIETGPVRKDGGFSLIIRQRRQGGIVTALRVTGTANDGGIISLEVRDSNDYIAHSFDTAR